ncbi:hypothetical protein SKAU_G00207980 [Synaphobranchus kaupii]|uniref:Uncharacterized protein n=1 Tax=Synaphobranchus kaupii TaxID=118154 RepID=A0A9Q1F894_SYNKA|nr:hypothetical protein SKAU_G00207980 [Synaphobranchus kaupii]
MRSFSSVATRGRCPFARVGSGVIRYLATLQLFLSDRGNHPVLRRRLLELWRRSATSGPTAATPHHSALPCFRKASRLPNPSPPQPGPVLPCRSESLPCQFQFSPGSSPVQFRFGTIPFQYLIPVWTSRSSSSPVQFRFGTFRSSTCTRVDLPVQSSPVQFRFGTIPFQYLFPVWTTRSSSSPVQFRFGTARSRTSSPAPAWSSPPRASRRKIS